RMKGALMARDRDRLSSEAGGLARLPLDALRGSDPNWSFARMHELEAARGGRSTHFVMAGHHHPLDGDGDTYDRVRTELVDLVRSQGDEVGLHPSYTAGDHPDRLADEKGRLESAVGGPIQSVRFHFLRYDPHSSLAQLDQLGFAIDSSGGYADRPGPRAGFSVPYRPHDPAAPRELGPLGPPLAVVGAPPSERPPLRARAPVRA